MKGRSLFLLFFLLCFRLNAAVYQISSQEDFEAIDSTIIHALKLGDQNIVVRFSPGDYFCKSWHLRLVDLNYPHASIKIIGNNTNWIGEQRNICQAPNPNVAYSLTDGRMYYPWTELSYLKDTIEIADKSKSVCRLLANEGLKDDDTPEGKYVRITTCYKSYCYPIAKIHKGYVYFDAGEMCRYTKESMMGVNADYAFGRKYPRYQLFGFDIDKQSLHSTEATYCIVLSNTSFKSFSIWGINVRDIGGDGCFIALKNAVAKAHVFRNTSFDNMVGGVCWSINSNNIKFVGCCFQNLYNGAITIENDCKGAIVEKCVFKNCGIGNMNSRCIEVRNEDFTICNNKFENFGYGAIGVGLWYGGKKKRAITGVVENNEIFYSGKYLEQAELHNLQDGGAIYTYTQSDGVDIRYNFIHDFSGPYLNRGIFCDDGAKNIHLLGNVVINCLNSYAIDLRYCNEYKNYVPDFNTGNSMIDNIVSGKFRFEPRPENVTTAIEEGTIILSDYSMEANKVRLGKAKEPIDKSFKHFRNIRKYFK